MCVCVLFVCLSVCLFVCMFACVRMPKQMSSHSRNVQNKNKNARGTHKQAELPICLACGSCVKIPHDILQQLALHTRTASGAATAPRTLVRRRTRPSHHGCGGWRLLPADPLSALGLCQCCAHIVRHPTCGAAATKCVCSQTMVSGQKTPHNRFVRAGRNSRTCSPLTSHIFWL